MATPIFEIIIAPEEVPTNVARGKKKGWKLAESVVEPDGNMRLKFEPASRFRFSAPEPFEPIRFKNRQKATWRTCFLSSNAVIVIIVCCLSVVAVAALAPGDDTSTGTTQTRYIAGNASTVNVRSGPGTNYQIVGRLNYRTQITTLEEKDGWYKIEINNGEGWVSSELTTANIPPAVSNGSHPQTASEEPPAASIQQEPANSGGGEQSEPEQFTCPSNCAGARAMGLSPQQAAACGLDRDGDGQACYDD